MYIMCIMCVCVFSVMYCWPGSVNVAEETARLAKRESDLHKSIAALTSKMVGISLTKGQRVRLETPGGGGYGAPNDRSAAAVAKDVALGYLTPERATELYGSAWREARQ